jgi:hypothetical protein
MSDPAERTAMRDEVFDHACTLYHSLAFSLAKIIEIFNNKTETGEALSDDDLKLVKDHQKALLLVIGFEADIFKRHGAAYRDGPVLDLDAARAEVAGRLARLSDAPKPDPVSR